MWRWSSCLKLTHIHNNGGGTSESVSIIRVFKGTCQANRNSLQSTNCYSRPETIGNTTKLTIHYSSNIPNPMFRLWVQRVSNISCTLQLSVKSQSGIICAPFFISTPLLRDSNDYTNPIPESTASKMLASQSLTLNTGCCRLRRISIRVSFDLCL